MFTLQLVLFVCIPAIYLLVSLYFVTTEWNCVGWFCNMGSVVASLPWSAWFEKQFLVNDPTFFKRYAQYVFLFGVFANTGLILAANFGLYKIIRLFTTVA